MSGIPSARRRSTTKGRCDVAAVLLCLLVVSSLLPLGCVVPEPTPTPRPKPTYTPTPLDALANTKIAFTSDRDGNYEIYVMNADGTNPNNLTWNSAEDSRPAWSPFLGQR